MGTTAVTANPQAPIDTQSSPQSTAMVPQQAGSPQAPVQQGGPPPSSPVDTVASPMSDQLLRHHQGRMADILSAIGDALGGSTSYDVSRDPGTGKLAVTPRPSTQGEKWGRAASAALKGLGAGLSAGPGPGNLSRAAAGGIAAGIQNGQQQQQAQMDQANTDFNAQQATQTHNANMVRLNQQISEQAFDMAQRKTAAVQGMYDRQNAIAAKVMENPANKDLGVVTSSKELPELLSRQPDAIRQHANGQIHAEPEVDKDGVTTGVHYFYLDQDWKDRRNTAPVPMHLLTPNAKDPTADPTIETQMIPINGMSNGDIMLTNASNVKQIMDWSDKKQKRDLENRKETSEEGLRKGQTAEAYGAANEKNTNAALARNAAGNAGPGGAGGAAAQPFANDEDFQTMVRKLATADATLKDIPKRYGKNQPTIQNYVGAADRWSKANLGMGYSPTDIESEREFAGQKPVIATMDGIESLIGSHGAPGQLQQVLNLAQKAGLGENAPINEVENWAKRHLGDTAAKNFHTQVTEVSRKVGGLIGNPLLGGGETDAKLKNGNQAYGANPTIANLRGANATITEALGAAYDSYAGHNRFIAKRYGPVGHYRTGNGTAAAAGGISVTDPSGGVHTFSDQAAADNFKRLLAGIR